MKRLLAFVIALLLLVSSVEPLNAAAPDDAAPVLGQVTAAASSQVTAAPVTTPAAGSALIEQAVGYLLADYVDPLASGMLYQTAYDGAVAALRAAGNAPQTQTLAFANDPRQDAATFRAAYLALAGAAGSGTNQANLAYAAIRAVTAKIAECHTGFLDPDQATRFRASLGGQESYTGIGIVLIASRKPPTISKVFRGSPAEKAGLRPLDAIVTVDGNDVSQLLPDQLGPYLRGPAGTSVRLTIRRPGEAAPLEFTITRTVPVFKSKRIGEAEQREDRHRRALLLLGHGRSTRPGGAPGVREGGGAILDPRPPRQRWRLRLHLAADRRELHPRRPAGRLQHRSVRRAGGGDQSEPLRQPAAPVRLC
ncbi:MAG: PDZ domain-containing protein [Thermomicrobiales bacterium]